ncbi:MAG: serine hydrolase [Acidobacteriota bacterium]
MSAWRRWAQTLLLAGLVVCGWIAPCEANPGGDLDSQNWAPLDAAVQAQMAAGKLPGAVMIYGDAQHIWLRRAWGLRARVPQPEPMTVDTVFDLASLTKVVVTTTAMLQLMERGAVQLDSPVARYWPAFAAHGKESITVRQLLTHTSGLRADLDMREPWQGRAQALQRVVAERPVVAPGSRVIYSDINFIVLGELVERLTGLPLQTYAQRRIFKPLGMPDTGFLPASTLLRRLAPTEWLADGRMMRGQVHDPSARRMGGVAGHAGLFGTADDLARFAQAMLQPGRLFKPATLAALQVAAGPPNDSDPRGLGWALQAPLVANRDELAPQGLIAHTGYTGTGIWIDLVQRRFVVLLSNRVHPNGRGDARPIRRQVLALLSAMQAPWKPDATAGESPLPGQPAAPAATAPRVLTGIDVLRAQHYAPLQGRRVGLITHLAAVDGMGWRTLDRLRWAPGVQLIKVFSPEHGLYGDAEGAIPSGVEPLSGLPLVSLYGERRRPHAQSLQDIDTLVFDVQDAGARFFTYISTLVEAMEAAAEHGLRVVVLDRPNPIRADRVGGPVLDEGRGSFTGYPGLPVQHGMTVGELARWFQDDIQQRRGVKVDLLVIAMQGYRRDQWFDQTGLDWVPPSPNLRTPTTAILYPGVAWVEGANISVGRGTDHPFEWVGAPWIDADALSLALNAAALPGVQFSPIAFVPDAGPYRGRSCQGVQVRVVDRNVFDAPLLGAVLTRELQALWPQDFQLDKTLALIGSADTLQGLRDGVAPQDWSTRWQEGLARFLARRATYLLYGPAP